MYSLYYIEFSPISSLVRAFKNGLSVFPMVNIVHLTGSRMT